MVKCITYVIILSNFHFFIIVFKNKKKQYYSEMLHRELIFQEYLKALPFSEELSTLYSLIFSSFFSKRKCLWSS